VKDHRAQSVKKCMQSRDLNDGCELTACMHSLFELSSFICAGYLLSNHMHSIMLFRCQSSCLVFQWSATIFSDDLTCEAVDNSLF